MHLGSSAYASNAAAVATTPLHTSPALSDSASVTVVDNALATELVALCTSGVADPSQPLLSGSSTSAAEPTMVDDTLATGYDTSEFLSTLLGLSQPPFDLSVSISAAEFMTVNDTLAAGCDTSQFLSTLSGPSQHTFDLDAGTSTEFTTAEYKALQSLSTLFGSFDLNTGIHAAELTTADEMLQFISTLSDPAGPSQPIFDLGSSTSIAESMVDDALAADMLQFLSLSDPTDPSQHTFDLSIPAAQFTTTDGTLATGSDVSQPVFDMGAGISTAESTADNDDELVAELTAELNALLPPSTSPGSTSQFTLSRNGPKRRRNARALSKQKLTNKSSSYPPIQGEPSCTDFVGLPSNDPFGSDNQQLMATFNPLLPGDRAVDVPDASAMGSYPFSFNFNALPSVGNVNAPQLSTFVPGTSNSFNFNDAGTSNVFGGATIGANEQAEDVFSTQMSQPLFNLGMTGGQSYMSNMDTATYEDFGMGAGSSVVDTMQSTSSSLFNALGSQHPSTQGSTNILRTSNTGGSEGTDTSGRRSENVGS